MLEKSVSHAIHELSLKLSFHPRGKILSSIQVVATWHCRSHFCRFLARNVDNYSTSGGTDAIIFVWDFLNMYFRNVYKPIPNVYNLVLAMLWRHPENVELEKVKVVHYCAAGSKPWGFTGKEANMDREDTKMPVKKWWDVYNDESLDYKNTAPAPAVLPKTGIVRYITAPSAA